MKCKILLGMSLKYSANASQVKFFNQIYHVALHSCG